MSDVSIYRAYLTAAIAAMEAGDWGTVGDEILKAETALAALPDAEVANDRVEWGRQLASLKADVRSRRAAAVGIQRTKIKYVPTTD